MAILNQLADRTKNHIQLDYDAYAGGRAMVGEAVGEREQIDALWCAQRCWA